MKIEKDKVVEIHYTLRLANGEVVDSTDGEAPFPYLHGADNIVPGLEARLEGRRVGDRLSVPVAPAEGFGEYKEDLVHEIGLDAFPEEMDLAEGDEVFWVNDDDEEIPGIIEQIKDETMIVNYNHPLAGETLTFEVEIMNVREATAEELDHGHAHDEHSHPHDEDENWDK